MTKRNLAIATIHAQTGKFLRDEIKNIFKDRVNIKRYSFSDRSIERGIASTLLF